MGRWVTSKGRRIYIPDENEEGELADKYRQRVKEVKAEIEKHPSKGLPGATEHYDYKHHYEDSDNVRYSKSKSINKDLDTKEKQIAENKKQVDKLNGKTSKMDLSTEGTYKLSGQRAPKDLPKVSAKEAKANKVVKYNGTEYQTQPVSKDLDGKDIHGVLYVPRNSLDKGSFFVAKDGTMWHDGSQYLNSKSQATKSPTAQANNMTEKELRAYVKKNGLTKNYNMMLNNKTNYSQSNQMKALRDLVADDIAVKEARKKKKK